MNNQTATKLRFEGLSVGRFVLSVIVNIICHCLISVFLGLLGIPISVIPILNIIYWILAILFLLVVTIDIYLTCFGMLFGKAILTEDGIYGNKKPFGKFDLTFDKIIKIDYQNNHLVIEYVDDYSKKKKKVKVFAITNAKDFTNDCVAQYQKYQVLATAAADAE